MKLAEALIERADYQRSIAQLKERIELNVKVQEGEEPAEKIDDLIVMFNKTNDALSAIVKRINRTNATTMLDGATLIDAIVTRDRLRAKIGMYQCICEAAQPKQSRYSRSELKFIRYVDVAELRETINTLSKECRELETKIQAYNWTVELME